MEGQRITFFERAKRIVVGAGLVGAVFLGTGPITWAALLPILAVIPILSAMLGYCPLKGVASRAVRAFKRWWYLPDFNEMEYLVV